MCGWNLQPGVEDGGTPTEVVAGVEEDWKQENPIGKEKKKIPKKGGPWVPGRGGSHNIGSRA